jgi:hypothetical protein
MQRKEDQWKGVNTYFEESRSGKEYIHTTEKEK